MIKSEIISDGTLIRHYSDSGYMIMQNETNNLYPEAIDRIPCRYTYAETTELIEEESEEANDKRS